MREWFDDTLPRIAPWLWIGGAGMIGRLMYHAKQVQAGKRKPLSWILVLDIPIALGSGWAAYGLSTTASLAWEASVSLAIIAAYMGPYGIDTLFAKWSDMKFGTKGQTNESNG